MSSLFGQVWLWSLLSFVAGVALTWLVLVRPAKKELEDLEERLLDSPRPTAPPPKAARDEFDDWHVDRRSPVEDLLQDEPPRYDVANMKLDRRDELLEELDDEHRPLSDFEEQHDFPELEDDRPRSLFERLTPGATGPVPEQALRAEETHLIPAAGPVAEPATPQPEPTAPPEVEAFQPREVWREEQAGVPEVYGEDEDPAEGPGEEDEPETPAAEQTTLIPATALARAIAEVDATEDDRRREDDADEPAWQIHPDTGSADEPVWQTQSDTIHTDDEPERPRDGSHHAEPTWTPTGPPPAGNQDQPTTTWRSDGMGASEPQLWPDHDLTGEYPAIRAELPLPEPDPAGFYAELTAQQESAPRHRDQDPSASRTELLAPIPADPLAEPPPTPTARHAEPAAHPEPALHPEPAAHAEPANLDPEPTARHAEPPAAHAQPTEPPADSATFVEPEAKPEPTHPEPFTPHAEPFAAHAEQASARPEPFAAHAEQTPARPEQAAPAEPAPPRPEPAKPAAQAKPEQPKEPTRPRSLFEPLLTPEDIEDEPPAPPKPTSSANDQPFVPKLAPELLASAGNGLPQRPTRPANGPNSPHIPHIPPPPPPVSQPINPPPPRPVRPRPVGFSPSTGGRPANSATTRYQQPEGFNPRSPFGPGSVLPKSDGMAPAPDFYVKATLTGRRYYTNDSANFRETRADVWFRTISDAEKAGFRPAP
ncbi:hypothetical protein ACQPZF_39490 [Actinosynnema sp. CS-041913]|uniref:sunset domain-containing protein n=1 Tax=Actinosynnema sp. CS-041913 TaxID=3239917 RepID=UPI003D919EA2